MNSIVQWFWVSLLAMLPISELRGAIPLALGKYDMNPYVAVPIIVIANMIPVPFILLFFKPIETYLRKWPFWDNLINKLFNYTRNKTRKNIEKWEGLALAVFVGIPLPATGAWTGSLAAYLFGLDFKKSLFWIFIGVCIAAAIVTTATIVGIKWLL